MDFVWCVNSIDTPKCHSRCAITDGFSTGTFPTFFPNTQPRPNDSYFAFHHFSFAASQSINGCYLLFLCIRAFENEYLFRSVPIKKWMSHGQKKKRDPNCITTWRYTNVLQSVCVYVFNLHNIRSASSGGATKQTATESSSFFFRLFCSSVYSLYLFLFVVFGANTIYFFVEFFFGKCTE